MSRTEETLDLDRWGEAWRDLDPPARRVDAASVRRRARRELAGTVAQWVVEAVVLVWIAAFAWTSREPSVVVAAVVSWTIALIVGLWETRSRHGTWRGETLAPAEFAALYRARLEARLRSIRLGAWVLALEVAFFVPWIAWVVSGREHWSVSRAGLAYGLLCALTGAALYVGRAWKRRAEGELARMGDEGRARTEPAPD